MAQEAKAAKAPYRYAIGHARNNYGEWVPVYSTDTGNVHLERRAKSLAHPDTAVSP